MRTDDEPDMTEPTLAFRSPVDALSKPLRFMHQGSSFHQMPDTASYRQNTNTSPWNTRCKNQI